MRRYVANSPHEFNKGHTSRPPARSFRSCHPRRERARAGQSRLSRALSEPGRNSSGRTSVLSAILTPASLPFFAPCPRFPGKSTTRVVTQTPKALERFKRGTRQITRRAKSVSIESTMEEMAPYLRAWCSHFGFCATPEALTYLTCWSRSRLRTALWWHWKTPPRRRAVLVAPDVFPQLTSNTACSRRGPWYRAWAKVLSVGLSNADHSNFRRWSMGVAQPTRTVSRTHIHGGVARVGE